MKILKPQITIFFPEIWTEEENKKAILRAAQTCRRGKEIPIERFDSFCQEWIMGKKHYKLLEHSLVGYWISNKEKQVYFRDWKNNDKDKNGYDYINYGSLRDLLELYDNCDYYIGLFLNAYGLIKNDYFDGNIHYSRFNCFNNISELLSIKNKCVQILIKTNRHTAMQLRTHQAISWLCESSRFVDYTKRNNFNICSIDEILNDEKFKEEEYETFETYQDRIKRGIKPEQARSCLTSYRETHIIGFARITDWLDFCKKRIGVGEQSDAGYVANIIYDKIQEILK